MALPLKINDPQLASTVQPTLATLRRHGVAFAGRHQLPAQQVKALGLTVHALRELVTAGLAEVVNTPGGKVVRPMTSVATEVELFDNGDIAVTLALDLV